VLRPIIEKIPKVGTTYGHSNEGKCQKGPQKVHCEEGFVPTSVHGVFWFLDNFRNRFKTFKMPVLGMCYIVVYPKKTWTDEHSQR
jgi:hypothetical protein